jgi:predicted transcriptional regulator
MAVIKRRRVVRKVARSFRLRPDLVERVRRIATERRESQTYVLESLLEYALEAYEKEERGKKAKDGSD